MDPNDPDITNTVPGWSPKISWDHCGYYTAVKRQAGIYNLNGISLRSIVLTIAVLSGVKYGIEGVAAMVTISALLLFSIIQRITNKLIDLDMYNYFKAIYPAITGSISLIIAVIIYKK